MKKLNIRLVRPLLALMTLLAVAVVIVLGVKYRAQRNAPEGAEKAPGVLTAQSSYSAIAYWNGATTLSFAVNESGVWTWVDDPDFPLDTTDILAMAEELATLTPQQTITQPEALETYGLDDPSATLSAIASDEDKLTLTFGKATTDGKSRYMLMNGADSPVYIIDNTLMTQMNKAVYDMMSLPAMPAMTVENLESVVLSAGKQQSTLIAVRERDKDGNIVPNGTVFWKINGKDAGGRADAVLAELGELTVSRCVDFKPSAHAVTLCGLDTPAAQILVTYRTEAGTEQTLTLFFGKATAEGRYVRMNEDSTIYLVATDSVDALLPAAVNGFSGAE